MAKLTAPKYGVTEGIITSIPSNYYMYMENVKREYLKKEQQAHDIAQRAVANWQNQYFKEAEERDIEIFVKHFFPMLVQAISVYFSVAFVYCKIELPKVAKQKWTKLHVPSGHCCKTLDEWFLGTV